MRDMQLLLKSYPRTWVPGWSITRYDTFSACRRRYFYQYYPSFDREVPREKINRLKELTSIPLESGSLVHVLVAIVLRRLLQITTPIDEEKLSGHMAKVVQDKLAGREFFEVYYGEMQTVPSVDILNRVEAAVWNFVHSARFDWIRSLAEKSDPRWIIEVPGFGEGRIGGFKVFCKPDFLCLEGEKVFVFDWKTGSENPEKHERQLAIYTLWSAAHFDVSPAKIRPILVYFLPDYREYPLESNVDPDAVTERIRRKTEELYDCLTDVQENRPKPKDKFSLTENISFCRWCNFKELCER